MPSPSYKQVRKVNDIPPLAVVVKEMLKDYDLPPDEASGGVVRGSGR